MIRNHSDKSISARPMKRRKIEPKVSSLIQGVLSNDPLKELSSMQQLVRLRTNNSLANDAIISKLIEQKAMRRLVKLLYLNRSQDILDSACRLLILLTIGPDEYMGHAAKISVFSALSRLVVTEHDRASRTILFILSRLASKQRNYRKQLANILRHGILCSPYELHYIKVTKDIICFCPKNSKLIDLVFDRPQIFAKLVKHLSNKHRPDMQLSTAILVQEILTRCSPQQRINMIYTGVFREVFALFHSKSYDIMIKGLQILTEFVTTAESEIANRSYTTALVCILGGIHLIFFNIACHSNNDYHLSRIASCLYSLFVLTKFSQLIFLCLPAISCLLISGVDSGAVCNACSSLEAIEVPDHYDEVLNLGILNRLIEILSLSNNNEVLDAALKSVYHIIKENSRGVGDALARDILPAIKRMLSDDNFNADHTIVVQTSTLILLEIAKYDTSRATIVEAGLMPFTVKQLSNRFDIVRFRAVEIVEHLSRSTKNLCYMLHAGVYHRVLRIWSRVIGLRTNRTRQRCLRARRSTRATSNKNRPRRSNVLIFRTILSNASYPARGTYLINRTNQRNSVNRRNRNNPSGRSNRTNPRNRVNRINRTAQRNSSAAAAAAGEDEPQARPTTAELYRIAENARSIIIRIVRYGKSVEWSQFALLRLSIEERNF